MTPKPTSIPNGYRPLEGGEEIRLNDMYWDGISWHMHTQVDGSSVGDKYSFNQEELRLQKHYYHIRKTTMNVRLGSRIKIDNDEYIIAAITDKPQEVELINLRTGNVWCHSSKLKILSQYNIPVQDVYNYLLSTYGKVGLQILVRNTWEPFILDEPIKVGDYDVVINNANSCRVGCTTVTRDKINQILARMDKLKK